MAQFSFESLLKTTKKGIPETYTETTSLSQEFYSMSLGLEIIFMLLFISYFGMALFRAFKKIKNPKFKASEEPESEQSQEQSQSEHEEQGEGKQTNDNLIYRFDEQDHEKQKKMEDNEDEIQEKDKQKSDEQNNEEENDDEYDNEHDENEEKFLQIDHKVMFLQPFLIGHIICINLFACDALSLGMLAGTIILFLIFNIKQACSSYKILSLLFMIPGLLSFLPIFINDHDMST